MKKVQSRLEVDVLENTEKFYWSGNQELSWKCFHKILVCCIWSPYKSPYILHTFFERSYGILRMDKTKKARIQNVIELLVVHP